MKVIGNIGKCVLISYANEFYKKAQHLNSWTAQHIGGFECIIEYNSEDIDEHFRMLHKDIFAYERGDGLWLWKPYLIKKTLDGISDGDILFYCDSGACFFRTAESVLRILQKQDVWVTILPLIEKNFTKKYTFEALGLSDKKYTETPQISGSFIALKKTPFTIQFVNEWLYYCCQRNIISPVEDKTQEMEDFLYHREDQSILSLLVKKYNIKYYSDPSQYGRLPEKYRRENCVIKYYGKEDYRPFILHHRTTNGKKSVLFRQWLCAVLPRSIGLKIIQK